MIEGLKLDFSTEQLRAHLEKKIAYHRQKAEWYGNRINDLKSGGLEGKQMSNDPMQSLERSRQTHAERAGLFEVMKEHLIPNEIYRLQESDLIRLELIGEAWHMNPYR